MGSNNCCPLLYCMEEEKKMEPEQEDQQLNENAAAENAMADNEPLNDLNALNDPNDNMEVHHHAHHDGKKNWKTYFWEFLMLFLAVFCGFLAEYQLEHKIERDREKKFIQTFIEDLKVDTAAINANLIFQKRKRDQLNTLTNLLREQKIKGYENELYYLGRILVRTTRFQSSDRTIIQLKYSGSLRLIRNEDAADSIISYQKLVDYILQNIDDERIERRAVDPLLTKIFNPFVFDSMLDEFNNVNKPVDNPPLRSYDPSLQQDLAFCINQLKGSNIIISTRLKLLNEKAKNIIGFLQKEYNLE
jgi:hypothetical protein